MFNQLLKRKESDKIKKERAKWLEECLEKIPKLRKLISKPDSGWPEFVEIINDYISHIERRKVVTSLDTADDKTIQELKYLDHEKYILKFIIGAVNNWINKVEARRLEIQKQEREDRIKRESGRF